MKRFDKGPVGFEIQVLENKPPFFRKVSFRHCGNCLYAKGPKYIPTDEIVACSRYPNNELIKENICYNAVCDGWEMEE